MAKQTTSTILRLLFMLCMVTIVLGQFSCDPFIDCSTSADGDMVPNPYDCEQYYVCMELVSGAVVPSSIPTACGSGYYFDQNSKACVQGTPGTCINLCQNICPEDCYTNLYAGYQPDCKKYYYCYLPPSAFIVDCVEPNLYFNGTACQDDPSRCCDYCDIYCNNGGQIIQDPCDCTSYFVCSGQGTPSAADRATCPSGSYFDKVTVSCVLGQCFNFCSDLQCAGLKK